MFPLEKLATLLRSGELPLLQYLNDVLAQLETEDGKINSFLREPDRAKRVLAEGETLLSRYPEPKDRPPLFGIPVGVKDLFNVTGLPTHAGSKLPAEAFAGAQATVVSRLKHAGAIVLGKTVSTEFAYFNPGPTRNPVNTDHSPGGSSSGSAAAIAQGLCPLALGTQTIASVNRPAAYCGIWGFKPSYGRIPLEGVFPFAQSVDHVGYFATRQEDIRYCAPYIVDSWEETVQPLSLSLLIPTGEYLNQADAESLALFVRVRQTLERKALNVQQIDLFPDIEDINDRHKYLIAAEFARNHEHLYARYEKLYSAESRDIYLLGSKISSDDLESSRKQPLMLRNQIQKLMASTQTNLIVCPGATSAAPFGLEFTGSPLMSLPFTNAGLPTISVPITSDSQGLPIGIQLVAGFGCDEFLLHAALEIHRHFSAD